MVVNVNAFQNFQSYILDNKISRSETLRERLLNLSNSFVRFFRHIFTSCVWKSLHFSHLGKSFRISKKMGTAPSVAYSTSSDSPATMRIEKTYHFEAICFLYCCPTRPVSALIRFTPFKLQSHSRLLIILRKKIAAPSLQNERNKGITKSSTNRNEKSLFMRIFFDNGSIWTRVADEWIWFSQKIG